MCESVIYMNEAGNCLYFEISCIHARMYSICDHDVMVNFGADVLTHAYNFDLLDFITHVINISYINHHACMYIYG